VRFGHLAFVLSVAVLPMTLSGHASAQSLRIGPGGVEVRPAEPPRRGVPAPVARDELRDRMLGLRIACEDGDRRACVRMGIIIGENRERREMWRRENPEVFFYER